MNQEHYERVKRVLNKSRAAKDKVFGKRKRVIVPKSREELDALVSNIMKIVKLCGDLWEEEFSEGGEDAKGLHLDLSGADLSRSLFAGAGHPGRPDSPLNYADLRHANLDNTQWLFFEMRHADLTGASLRKAGIEHVWFGGSIFSQANLSGATIELWGSEDSTPVDFTGANLSGAIIQLGSWWIPMILTEAQMDGCRVERAGENVDIASFRKNLRVLKSGLSKDQRAQTKVEKTWWNLVHQFFAGKKPPIVRNGGDHGTV